MHARIEKSGFRPGEYVGYCDGAWRITKIDPPCIHSGAKWRAVKNDGSDSFRATSLDKIGSGLDQRANIVTGKILFGSK